MHRNDATQQPRNDGARRQRPDTHFTPVAKDAWRTGAASYARFTELSGGPRLRGRWREAVVGCPHEGPPGDWRAAAQPSVTTHPRHTVSMASREAHVKRRTSYRFELSIGSVLVGLGLLIAGLLAGVAPMFQRRAPCFYSLMPPAEFVAEYHEGIGGTGPWVSMFPYGARCSYVANATGETAISELSLWPSIMIIAGFVLLVLGLLGAVRAYRGAR